MPDAAPPLTGTCSPKALSHEWGATLTALRRTRQVRLSTRALGAKMWTSTRAARRCTWSDCRRWRSARRLRDRACDRIGHGSGGVAVRFHWCAQSVVARNGETLRGRLHAPAPVRGSARRLALRTRAEQPLEKWRGSFHLHLGRIIDHGRELQLGALEGADARKALLIVGIMTLHSFAEGVRKLVFVSALRIRSGS